MDGKRNLIGGGRGKLGGEGDGCEKRDGGGGVERKGKAMKRPDIIE
jgi:hypothetical protein